MFLSATVKWSIMRALMATTTVTVQKKPQEASTDTSKEHIKFKSAYFELVE